MNQLWVSENAATAEEGEFRKELFGTSINHMSIWKCFDFDALLKGFLLSCGRGDSSTKIFWYHRAPHQQVRSTRKEKQKSAQNGSPTWMNCKEEEKYGKMLGHTCTQYA